MLLIRTMIVVLRRKYSENLDNLQGSNRKIVAMGIILELKVLKRLRL